LIPYRTLLFVPGHKTGWVEKALAAGADCLVLDLEDSCPAELKESARDMVASSIRAIRERDPHIGILVRVNALGTRMTGADLEAVVVPGLTGVFVPMVSTAGDVLKLDALVDHFEVRNGVSGLEYIVPTETVGAIQNVREIASASPRIGALIGPTAEHADIARAVGFRWTPEGQESLYLRSRVLLACREAGVHPLTALWERLDDLDGLADFAGRGRDLGFRGMVVIHPTHVPVVNGVFSPSAEETDFYEQLIAAYDDAAARGDGAARYRGVHIDRAHVDTARDWLDLARSRPGRRAGAVRASAATTAPAVSAATAQAAPAAPAAHESAGS
jgi:citrate lyase subunit beta / citryl-CoA lyase